jgi:hypothetical protein
MKEFFARLKIFSIWIGQRKFNGRTNEEEVRQRVLAFAKL